MNKTTFLKNPEIYTFETAITSRYISEIFPKGKLPNPSFSHPRLKCVLTQGGATTKITGEKKPTTLTTFRCMWHEELPELGRVFQMWSAQRLSRTTDPFKATRKISVASFFVAEENHGNGYVRCEKRCRRRDFRDVPFSSFFPQNIFFQSGWLLKETCLLCRFFFWKYSVS